MSEYDAARGPEIVGEGGSSGVAEKAAISGDFRRGAVQFARLHADNDHERSIHRTAAAEVMIMSDLHNVENAGHPSQTESDHAESSGDDVLDIIADVEGRLERLRQVSRESGAMVDSMHQRQAALETRQAELDRRDEALQQDSAALQQRTVEIEQREKHAESLCELADNERREIDEIKQSIEADRHALAQEREAIDRQRVAVNQDREQLAAEQSAFRAQVETLAQDRAQLQQQLTEVQEQRTHCENEHRAAMQAVDKRMDEIQQERDERSAELQSQLDEARKQVAALKEHLEVQRAEAGKIEKSHAAELEHAALRSDSLQADLDAAQQRAVELEAALNKTKGELQTRHEQLEATKRKLIELGKALDGQSEQIQAGTSALAALEGRDRRIAELESQLASGGGGESAGVDPAELAVRDQRINALEREISSLEAQVQAATNAASSSSEGTDEELATRDQAIEELSKHIRSLQGALKEAQAETAQRVNEINRLTESLEEIQTRPDSPSTCAAPVSDEFTTLRRQRLHRMRKAIRDRSRRLNKARDVVKQQAHQVRESEEDKRTLLDVRRNLEQAEQRMIRRWARSSTITNLFLMVLTLAILGGASYFGVMTFWPASYTAHATIEAKGKPGFPLTDTQINLWQTVIEEMLLSDPIVNGIALRMEQRGYADLSEPAKLKEFLQAHLVTASTAPGSLNLELTTVGHEEAQRLLETYTIGLVSASNAERGRRTDGATSTLSVPVAVDAIPAKDDRVQVAGIAFGSSVAGLLLLGLPVYLKLRRSASVFTDEDLDGPLMGTERWSEISNGAQNAEHVIS